MITDYDYILNTNEKGYCKLITDFLEGEFCAIIIKSNKQCSLNISFENKDITLLEGEFSGERYIPIATLCCNNKNEIINNYATKYYLNNKLDIIINGSPEEEILVTLRVEK